MEKYTGRSCKWQGSSFIYCFKKKYICGCFILQQEKAPTATLCCLLLWAHAKISLHAAAASCYFTVGSGSVYHWGWSVHVSHATFSSRVFKCMMVRWCVLYVSISAFSSHDAAASYWVNKLVHQSLRHIRLADDALLVVLTYGAAQLVIVHSGSILSESPQSGNVSRVFNFKNT